MKYCSILFTSLKAGLSEDGLGEISLDESMLGYMKGSSIDFQMHSAHAIKAYDACYKSSEKANAACLEKIECSFGPICI